MLTAIENRLEELFEQIELMPRDLVEAATKVINRPPNYFIYLLFILHLKCHLGKEEVYVVSGRLRISDATLEAGDYHHTGPGERHELEAFEDCMFFASTEQVIPGR